MEDKDISALMDGGFKLPPVPMVASKVLTIVNDPDGTIGQIEEAIKSDGNLVSRILGIANSAYYRRLERVKNIKAAINVLGFKAVSNLVMATSTRLFYNPFGQLEKMLWEHSVGTAVTCAFLSTKYRLVPPDEALLAGLMHDIGKTIINLAKPEQYRKLAEIVYNHDLRYFDCEERALKFTHCDVGSTLVVKWNFPIEFGKVIHYHHRIDEIDPDKMDPYQVKLIAVVDFANQIMHKLGIGYRNPEENLALNQLQSLKLLKISLEEEEIEPLLEQVQASYEEEKSKFD